MFRVIADPRSNALVIVAGRDEMALALDLIAKLDVRLPPGARRFMSISWKMPWPKISPRCSQPRPRSWCGPSVSNRPLGHVHQPSQLPPRPPRPPPPPQTGPTSGVVPTATGERKITITPDKATNSLVVTAIPEDYQALVEVIKRLDIPRRQVYVEAAVIEITMEKTKELGVEWRSTSDFTTDSPVVFGGQSFGLINDLAQNPFALSGLAIGLVSGTITFGGQTFLNIGALLQAIQHQRCQRVIDSALC